MGKDSGDSVLSSSIQGRKMPMIGWGGGKTNGTMFPPPVTDRLHTYTTITNLLCRTSLVELQLLNVYVVTVHLNTITGRAFLYFVREPSFDKYHSCYVKATGDLIKRQPHVTSQNSPYTGLFLSFLGPETFLYI